MSSLGVRPLDELLGQTVFKSILLKNKTQVECVALFIAILSLVALQKWGYKICQNW